MNPVYQLSAFFLDRFSTFLYAHRLFVLFEKGLQLFLFYGKGFRLTLELRFLIVTDFLKKPHYLFQLFRITQRLSPAV